MQQFTDNVLCQAVAYWQLRVVVMKNQVQILAGMLLPCMGGLPVVAVVVAFQHLDSVHSC